MKTQPLIIPHRGRTAGDYRENTLEAFEQAIKIGADMIEFDVRRTGDGQLIIYHDRTIKGQQLSNLSYDQIKSRLGYTPPLFTEALALGNRIKLDIELKEDGYIDEVLDLIQKSCPADQVVVTSFLSKVIRQVKQLAPDLKAGVAIMHPVGSIKRAANCHADYLVIYYPVARWVLDQAARAGLPCLVWTVNNPKMIQRFLVNDNVIGIITDVPERALAIAGRTT